MKKFRFAACMCVCFLLLCLSACASKKNCCLKPSSVTRLNSCPFANPDCMCTQPGAACLIKDATNCCCLSSPDGGDTCPLIPVGPSFPATK